MGFTRAELESFRDVEVPDLLPAAGQPLRLLFVGINPGLWTAATQSHFARPGNRFYPALLRAGILTSPIDPAAGMTDEDRDVLRRQGIGITNVAARATARADELTAAELREGGERLRALVAERRPGVVAVAGVTAYRTAFGEPRAMVGEQPGPLGRIARVRGAQPVGSQRPRDRRHAGPGLRRGGPGSRGAREHAAAVTRPRGAGSARQAAYGGGSRPCWTSTHSTRWRSWSSSSPGGRTASRWGHPAMSAASPRTRS